MQIGFGHELATQAWKSNAVILMMEREKFGVGVSFTLESGDDFKA